MTDQALLRGQSIAVNVAASAADAMLRRNDLQLISLALSTTKDHPNVVYAAIVDAKGKVKGHPDRHALGRPLDFVSDATLTDAPGGAVVRRGLTGEIKVWDIALPIRLKGLSKELGTVHVGLARDGVGAAVRASLWKLALISLLLLVLGVGGVAWSIPIALRPLRELAAATQRIGRGRYETRVPVRGQDELGHLAETFNEMAAGLEAAEQARSEHQRIEGELDLARKIQASMLPEHPPSVPGLDIAFRCVPAKELGGDFYDCIPLENGDLGFLIADVSGKGVPAALNVVNLRNYFRVVTGTLQAPADVVKRVNALAYPDLKGESFVTLVYGVLRPSSGQVRLVNAGHDPVYWLKASGSVLAFESTAMPVGLAEPADYDPELAEIAFTLGPGDRLLLFTDGATEAMDADGSLFGLEALQRAAGEPGTASETVLRVADAVANHANGVEPSDDVTLLALRWLG